MVNDYDDYDNDFDDYDDDDEDEKKEKNLFLIITQLTWVFNYHIGLVGFKK
jgi:hypothetical protein